MPKIIQIAVSGPVVLGLDEKGNLYQWERTNGKLGWNIMKDEIRNSNEGK